MDTHETYISLEVAKLLKEAGFDWEIDSLYQVYPEEPVRFELVRELQFNWNINSNVISAPTLAVAHKWLREVKGINIQIQSCFDSVNCQYNVVVGYDYFIHRIDGKMTILPSDTHYKSYEESLEAGIKKCLEIFLQEE